MKKLYCEYCGELLEENCNCLRELAEEKAEFLENYKNSLETQHGWTQQDAIDSWRNER